jgi:manganese transport protein
MAESHVHDSQQRHRAWWSCLGPALIMACMVFGPGSMLVSANVGATHQYELLWLLVLTGVLMATYVSMAARISVVAGATPCTLLAQHLNRPAAMMVGLMLFSICATFQFANNLAFAAAARALFPRLDPQWIVLGLNLLVILFLFKAQHIYRILERSMKIMVVLILVCFAANLIAARPSIISIAQGLIPHRPAGMSLALAQRVDGVVLDPMLLVASLLGTTFSVGAALYQGNLVREKGWGLKEYHRGMGDSITGVAVLTSISAIIMITCAAVIPGQTAMNVGMLAQSLQPLLGSAAYIMFCVGLLAVSLNPFLINAMMGGSLLADGLGLPHRLKDQWPRRFTVLVLLIGMGIAMLILNTTQTPIKFIIIGQALTVIGNPFMAVTLLWLANHKAIMGTHRNGRWANILGGVGLVILLLVAVRILWYVGLSMT